MTVEPHRPEQPRERRYYILTRSVVSLDTERIGPCSALSQKFSPSAWRGRRGAASLVSLIRTYFDLGGMQTLFNDVHRETLVDAGNMPEKYPGLPARVSGFPAYFADLAPEVEDEIIARSEQSFGAGRRV